jgi:serine/threonine-protein kinase
VEGRDVEEATRILEEAGFTVRTVEEPDDEQPAGTVIDQDPPGGEQAERGSTVQLTVSAGKEKVPVPDVIGKDRDAAANELGNAGFRTTTQLEESDSVDEGKVIRTAPAPGTAPARGSTVTMVVSSGQPEPEQVTVPDVIGKTQAQATAQLQAAGFKVSVDEQLVADDADDGRVIDQSPNAGTKQDEGSTVTITVGKKAAP